MKWLTHHNHYSGGPKSSSEAMSYVKCTIPLMVLSYERYRAGLFLADFTTFFWSWVPRYLWVNNLQCFAWKVQFSSTIVHCTELNVQCAIYNNKFAVSSPQFTGMKSFPQDCVYHQRVNYSHQVLATDVRLEVVRWREGGSYLQWLFSFSSSSTSSVSSSFLLINLADRGEARGCSTITSLIN